MVNKKTSVIAVAILTCIVCISMIAGATFALFTSEDKVNVSVTTAKLDVSADISDISKSFNGVSELNSQLKADYIVDGESKILSVQNMQPGDVVTFRVNVTSNATVDVKYRMSFGCKEENNALFNELLLGVKDNAEANYDYYVSSVSAWDDIAYSEDKAEMTVTKYVAIELPAYVGAQELQNQTCEIEFAVEAVQSNASGDVYNQAAKSVRAYRANSSADVAAAAELIENGDFIVLDGANGSDWTIDTQVEKEFSVKGCNVGTLTVNAPKATIHYLVETTQIIDVNESAPHSLHVYGNVVRQLVVKEGRAVVEQGAKVAEAIVQPEEGKQAEIVANESIANVSVEGAGVANVEIANEVVIANLVVNNANQNTAIENNGTVEKAEGENVAAVSSKVATAEAFAKAVSAGGEIVLIDDIDLNQLIYINKDIVINLNEHVINILLENGRPLNVNSENVSVTIENGDVVIPESNIRSYGFIRIDAENCSLDMSDVAIIGNTDVGALIRVVGISGSNITLTNVNASTNYLIVALQSAPSGKLVVNGGEFNLITQDSSVSSGSDKASSFFAGFNVWSGDTDYVDNLYAEFNNVIINTESRTPVSVSSSTVVFNDCTISNPQANDYAGYLATAISTSYMGKVTVNGGNYVAKQVLYVFSSGGYIVANSGTFVGDIRMDIDLGYHDSFGAEGSIELGKDVVWTEGQVINSSAGKEYCSFVWHVDTAEKLAKALEYNCLNYTIVLDADIELGMAINLVDKQSLTIDFNGNKLTIDGKKLVDNGAPIAAKGNSSLTLINGTIIPQNYRQAQSTIDMYDNANVALDNITIERLTGNSRSFGYGITAHGSGKIVINKSTIKSGCAVSTNASEDIHPVINITGSYLEGYATGLLFNVDGELNVSSTEIVGINQGVFMRAGTAKFTNSTIRATLEDLGNNKMITLSDAAGFNAYYLQPNWKDGTQYVPLAALVIGCSMPNSSYNKNANVTLVNTKVDESDEFISYKDESSIGLIHHAILAWNAHGDNGSAIITMDEASQQLLNGTVKEVQGTVYSAE